MKRSFAPLLLLLAAASPSLAADHDEAIDGDLSNNRLNPTDWRLDVGVNRLTCTQGIPPSGTEPLDRDYVTFVVPPGAGLASMELVSFSDPEELAFVGFMEGPRFTVTPFGATPGDLLGGAIYGPGDLGTDMFPAMNALTGVQGFETPLPSGEYTFWFNQGSFETTASFAITLVRLTTGIPYCEQPVNSTGEAGLLFGDGGNELAANGFSLHAGSLPQNELVVFAVAPLEGSTPMPGGGAGVLCLSGPIGRFQSQLMTTGALGSAAVEVDWTALPTRGGTIAASAGQTWRFQGWFTDGASSSGFTNALAVTLR